MTRAYAAAHRDVVQRYVDSILQAIARERGDRAYAIQVAKKYFQSDSDRDMGAVYDLFVKLVQPRPSARPEQFADAQATLGPKNEKVKTFDVTKLIDDSFVADAARRGVGGP